MDKESSKKGLTSTIILGVMLLFIIVSLIFIYSIRIGQAVSNVTSSSSGDISSSSSNAYGEVMGAAISGTFVALAFALLEFGGSGLIMVISILGIIFSRKNLNLENKTLKIINIVYFCLFSLGIIASILKLAFFL